MQRQRHCQITSQPDSRKQSRKLGKVAHSCRERTQKDAEQFGGVVEAGSKRMGAEGSKAAPASIMIEL